MGNFSDKNVLLCTQLYKYAPNLESLLTQILQINAVYLRTKNESEFGNTLFVENEQEHE
jgi:hypothetical protein